MADPPRPRLVFGLAGVCTLARVAGLFPDLPADQQLGPEDLDRLLTLLRGAVAACFDNAAQAAGLPTRIGARALPDCRDEILAAWADPAFRRCVDVDDRAAVVLARLEELDFLRERDGVPADVLLRAPEEPSGSVTVGGYAFVWGAEEVAALDRSLYSARVLVLSAGRFEGGADSQLQCAARLWGEGGDAPSAVLVLEAALAVAKDAAGIRPRAWTPELAREHATVLDFVLSEVPELRYSGVSWDVVDDTQEDMAARLRHIVPAGVVVDEPWDSDYDEEEDEEADGGWGAVPAAPSSAAYGGMPSSSRSAAAPRRGSHAGRGRSGRRRMMKKARAIERENDIALERLSRQVEEIRAVGMDISAELAMQSEMLDSIDVNMASKELMQASAEFHKRPKVDDVMADLESCINCCSGLIAWCMRPTMPRCDAECLCRPFVALCRLLTFPLRLVLRLLRLFCLHCVAPCWDKLGEPACSCFCKRCWIPFCDRTFLPLLRCLGRPVRRGCEWFADHVCEPFCDRCWDPLCDRVLEPCCRKGCLPVEYLCRGVGRVCSRTDDAIVRAAKHLYPRERIYSSCTVLKLLVRSCCRALVQVLLFPFTVLRWVRDRVVDCLAVVALLLLFLPAMFMLLVLRPTKAEVESTEFVQRAEVMETESAAKTATRRSHLVFRTLPMTALILIAPAVIVGFVMPELDEWAALLILGAQLGLMVVIQGLGTVRAATSWLELYRARARENKPAPPPPPFSLGNPANLLAIATLVVDLVQMASFPLSPSSSSSSDDVEEGGDAGGVIPLPSWCGDVFNVAYIQVSELADEWTAIDSILTAVAAVWVLIMIFARQFVHDLVCYSLMQRNEFKGEARQFFFGSFVGSVMYAHGRPHNVTANVALAIKLLTHTGFMVITSHLLQALACDYSGVAPVLIADPTVTCWEGEHQAVALAALVAFGYYLPLSVMIQPILSNRLEETPTAVRTVQVYAMATTLFKCVLLIVSSLTTSIEARVSTIFVIAVLMAASTFVWFVQLPASVLGAHQPISVAFFNRIKVLTYALCAWSAAVMLAALEETVVTEADFSTWLLAGWAPITALVLGWQLLGERYGIKRRVLKPFRVEETETEKNEEEPAAVFVACEMRAEGEFLLVEPGAAQSAADKKTDWDGLPPRDLVARSVGALDKIPSAEALRLDMWVREVEGRGPPTPFSALGAPVAAEEGAGAEVLLRRAPLGDGRQCVSVVPMVREDSPAPPSKVVLVLAPDREHLPAVVEAARAWLATLSPPHEVAVATLIGGKLQVLQPLTPVAKLDQGRLNDALYGVYARSFSEQDFSDWTNQLGPRKLWGAFPGRRPLTDVRVVFVAREPMSHRVSAFKERWPAASVAVLLTGEGTERPGEGGFDVVLRCGAEEGLDDALATALLRLDGVEVAGSGQQAPVTFGAVQRAEPGRSAAPWTRYAVVGDDEPVRVRIGGEQLAFSAAEAPVDESLVRFALLHELAAACEAWLADKAAELEAAREAQRAAGAAEEPAIGIDALLNPRPAPPMPVMGAHVDVFDLASGCWLAGEVANADSGHSFTVLATRLDGTLQHMRRVPHLPNFVAPAGSKTARMRAALRPTVEGAARERFEAVAAKIQERCPEMVSVVSSFLVSSSGVDSSSSGGGSSSSGGGSSSSGGGLAGATQLAPGETIQFGDPEKGATQLAPGETIQFGDPEEGATQLAAGETIQFGDAEEGATQLAAGETIQFGDAEEGATQLAAGETIQFE